VRATRAPAWGSIRPMLVLADVGVATALLERLATSMVAGTVVAGFLAAGWEVLMTRGRSVFEVNALKTTLLGGLGGIFCLLYDLAMR
jgi:hypothetical protein